MPTGRTVVVSAHLDDAVLSCGGRLAGASSPYVVTVFAGTPPAGTATPVWDRVTRASDSRQRVLDRLAEDEQALTLLGATPHRLDFLDGQYRNEPHDHRAAVAALRPLLAGAAEVWAAAGIGQHVDHLAARDAALEAVEPSTPVRLYADIPYVLVYGWPTWVDGSSARGLLDPGEWIAAELVSAGLDPDVLTAAAYALDGGTAAAKRAAMAAYATQLAALDAQCGGRLGDPRVMGFELSWSVTDGRSVLRPEWPRGAPPAGFPGTPDPAER